MGEQLEMIDADIWLWRHINLPIDDQTLLQQLLETTPWLQKDVTLWGKTHKQPRLVAWYGEHPYTYSGSQLDPHPWSETLLSLKSAVEQKCDTRFNSVLLNYYRNHQDAMGFHSDDEKELGSQPVIASLSLGDSRRFVLKHRRRKDVPDTRVLLDSASLLLMKGPTQANWKHGIPRESKPCGPRINLTFRRINY